jgi:hypothetical protein
MITEEKKIHLGKTFRDCPACWKNFYYYNEEVKTGTLEEFNRILAKWNARMIETKAQIFLEFGTDADKLLFLLRWS